MAELSNLYRLRRLHQISLYEMEAASGLSNQYISCVELGKIHATPQLSQKMDAAMERLIVRRKQDLLLLEADLAKYRGRLLELAEDKPHE